MHSEVIILCWKTPTCSDHRARKIAQFLGAKASFVSIGEVALRDVNVIRNLVPPCACLIAHAETLAEVADEMKSRVSGLSALTSLAKHVFVYGFQPADRHGRLLRSLSLNELLGIRPLESSDTQFRVADGYREWCAQFSGLSFGETDLRKHVSFLQNKEGQHQAVLIWAGAKPFFVRVNDGTTDLFVLASQELADLEEEVPSESSLLPWFPELVPLMMFLRGVLGQRLWHNDQPRACFIIDDPPLKSRYGFLEYRRLLETVRRQRVSVCIAFIPWNYRRSSKDIAELFTADQRIASLCVHGCDHTGAEFGTTGYESLCGKASLALDRMRAHHRLSGVPFDEVMVFPQGIFSSEALKALRDCGYLAAVNTALCPSDMPGALRLQDLLQTAVTRFAEFPLFSRHYPNDAAEFAFDLFLGKPALAVEHHRYFQNGYKSLEAFVETLKALEERLEWTNLARICSQACLTRLTESGDIHVRFYAQRFLLRNSTAGPQNYVVSRRCPPEAPVPTVTINGHHWDCTQEDDNLTITLSLDAGQTANISLVRGDLDPVALRRKHSGLHNARVFGRRLLCELRDNYVDTNPVLSAIASSARNLGLRRKTVLAEVSHGPVNGAPPVP